MSGRDWAAAGAGGLVEAVRKGHPRHVQLLLEAGAPVNDHDDTGITAMVAAVLTPQEDRLREKLLKLLLQAGADLNVGDTRGTTPLMHASISNIVPAVVFLLQQNKVDLSLQDGDGNSALMYAAAFGHREIVLLILAAFKKVHHVALQGQRNGQGLTAWQLAEKNGHEDIAALLKVESQAFGRPAGPSCFIPANPLDLDRPPTPTETKSIRSSVKRLKNTGRSNTVPPLSDPTAPLPPSGDASLSSGSGRRNCKEKNERTKHSSGKTRSLEDSLRNKVLVKEDLDVTEIEHLIGTTSVTVRSAVEKTSEREIKSKDPAFKGLSIARCRASRLANSSAPSETTKKGEDRKGNLNSSGKKNTRACALVTTQKNAVEKVKKPPLQTDPVVVTAPDAAERQVLEELMKDLIIAGSPGSGNEADTESLMECEESPREGFTVTTTTTTAISSSNNKMSGTNNRKMTTSGVPLTVAALTSPTESMPKIGLNSSNRSLNRSIQHLVQEDSENKPSQRPPTPARPSLPTLLPGRMLEGSLNASLTSTKSEGRYNAPNRRVTFSSFPRSSSEPRSLTGSPRPNQNPENEYDEEDSDEHSSDLLDSSTRSEGWDHLRGSRGRGPAFTSASGSHVVTLPPINQSKYTDSAFRGRDSTRGRSSAMTSHGENVLSVAKKTLEQLETVLAPSETSALSRAIPRTRATQQIHLET